MLSEIQTDAYTAKSSNTNQIIFSSSEVEHLHVKRYVVGSIPARHRYRRGRRQLVVTRLTTTPKPIEAWYTFLIQVTKFWVAGSLSSNRSYRSKE